MSYRNDFRELSAEVYWTIPRITAWVVTAGIFAVLGSFVMWPFLVASKVANPDAAITKYERFHDLYTAYGARQRQVQAFKLSEAIDKNDAAKLRTERAAIAQSCRDIAARYNADAAKLTVGIFKGWSLPERLEINACE